MFFAELIILPQMDQGNQMGNRDIRSKSYLDWLGR
jgi:hypothetical protein